MDGTDQTLPLLNVYEIEEGGARRHLVCFVDPVLAGARGIDPRSVVGEFTPGPGSEFDPKTFVLNPEFVESISGYMNDEATRSPDLIREATRHASGWLYIVDPRFQGAEDEEPPAGDMLGCFAVDGSGQIVPNSFLYNENHRLFDAETGTSAVLYDRRFYDWLHPRPEGARG